MKLKTLSAGILAATLGLLWIADCRRPPAYDWQSFASPDGKFAISFPGKPILDEHPAKLATGESYTSHRWTTKAADDAAFGCSWWEDPNLPNRSSDEMLNKIRDFGLYGVQGRLISERRFTLQGYPAKDIEARARGNLAMHNRIILVGTRVYTLLVFETSGKRNITNAERFFKSFSLH
ncbi:MAG: hypothetical protein DMG80_03705 [Acidobacteria bacterium]|nr:MAG: hypothetical protein DMG80_03705 [Acidobacteriota bacterium]